MGWVRIDRKLLDHWIWSNNNEAFSKGQAWVDLILLAEYDGNQYEARGSVIDRKRGEVHRSVMWFAERWKWSKNKVLRFFRLLENEKMITRSGTALGTAISIEKYEKYQTDETEDGTANETPHGTPTETVGGTQLKNQKTKKPKKEYKGFRPPTMEELMAYIAEKDLTVDAETFMDYYTANGWKVGNKTPMKDWRATVRNWHRRDGGKTLGSMAKNLKAKEEQARREAELEAEWAKEFEKRPKPGTHDIERIKAKYGIGRG